MSEPNTQVTVVLLCRDRREAAVRSARKLLELPERPAVVAVDNGSRDGTCGALAALGPRVQVVRLPDDRGAGGRNRGVLAARTPYVAFCDDDAWWEAGSLERACRLLDSHPRAGVLCARVLVEPEGSLDPASVEMQDSPLPDRDALPGRPIAGFLAGASVVRRRAFLEAGGFERRFHIGGEEALLAIDLLTRGWSLRYVPELTVRRAPSPQRRPAGRRAAALRNHLWTAWLRRGRAEAWRATADVLALARRDAAAARGVLEALAGAPWALARRRPAPERVQALLRLVDRLP